MKVPYFIVVIILTIICLIAANKPEPQDTTIKWIKSLTPIGSMVFTLLVALYALYKVKLEARYRYAAEILDYRMHQIKDFYAPAIVLIEQSRILYNNLIWTINKNGIIIDENDFKLLDHINKLRKQKDLRILIDDIINIGDQLSNLISHQSGLIEGGITQTYIKYQAHFKILKAAKMQKLSGTQKKKLARIFILP